MSTNVMEDYYGKKLDPTRNNRIRGGINAERQIIVINNNPAEVSPNTMLDIRFPNLKNNDVIVPNSCKLLFDLIMPKNTEMPVNNVSINIIKRIEISMEGNTILSIDNCNILYSYMHHWLPDSIKKDHKYTRGYNNNKYLMLMRLGHQHAMKKENVESQDKDGKKITTEKETIVTLKDVATADDKIMSGVFKNTFEIPLDFELLSTVMPFYQSGLGDRLSYQLTFNNTTEFGGEYSVKNIRLMFEKINSASLANIIKNEYGGEFSVLFDRILRHSIKHVNSADPRWNWNFASPVRSLRGILLIGKRDDQVNDPDKYWNMNIKNISVTIEGIPNQLYAQGMQERNLYDETKRFFGGYYKKMKNIDNMVKELNLSGVSIEDFYRDKYAVWLDFRSVEDNCLHGSGRRLVNNSEGITLNIERYPSGITDIYGSRVYVFIFMDGALNIINNSFSSVQW